MGRSRVPGDKRTLKRDCSQANSGSKTRSLNFQGTLSTPQSIVDRITSSQDEQPMQNFEFMGDFHLHIASTLGLLLGVCLAAGVLADMVHLPKVTAYLLVGLLVGPSFLDWIPEGHVEIFEPILKLAMAVVLFNLGCEFTFTKVRRVAAHCLALSIAEVLCSFVTRRVGAHAVRVFGK